MDDDLAGFGELPREPGAVWQVEHFSVPRWEEAEGEPGQATAWAAFALDLLTGELGMSGVAAQPEGRLAAASLPALAQRTGYRPARIQVTDLEVAEAIRRALESAGAAETEVELRDDLFELRTAFEAFRELMDAGAAGQEVLLRFCAETLLDAGRYAEAAEVLQELLRTTRPGPRDAEKEIK